MNKTGYASLLGNYTIYNIVLVWLGCVVWFVNACKLKYGNEHSLIWESQNFTPNSRKFVGKILYQQN